MEIRIEKTAAPKAKPDWNKLGFGKYFTDHMFMMDYKEGEGWHNARIVPYGPLTLDPAANVLQYGQTMFEGLKAYMRKDGSICLFRPDMNAKRTNNTNKRICMPEIPEELYLECIKALVEYEKEWVPPVEGTSLYIRPFIFGDEPFLGVHPSSTYKFVIILSPVGSYYENGMAPTKIYVEEEYVRAVKGGTGFAKIGANYVASLASQMKAHDKGYEQVLWLDGVERKYVEEIGTSNAFFVIDGEIWTAPLQGTILPGITRDSSITLLKSWGYTVREERLTIDEVFKASKEGRLSEMFATGTAAVISPVGELAWQDEKIIINNGEIGEISQKLFDAFDGIKSGEAEDKFGWIVKL